jgi:hypothetical protein
LEILFVLLRYWLGKLYSLYSKVLTQVFDQPDECETGGLYFPMAVENLCAICFALLLIVIQLTSSTFAVVGLYIEQICLACLFFLKIDTARGSSIAEGILMLVLVVITSFAQILIYKAFDRTLPLSTLSSVLIRHQTAITAFLPMSLGMEQARKKHERRKERAKLGIAGIAEDVVDEIDIFKRDRGSSFAAISRHLL